MGAFVNASLHARLMARPRPAGRVFLAPEGGEPVTYADLGAVTARYAHALAASGVGPGDRIAVQVEKSPEAVFLYLASLRAGAVYLPLNTAYTAAELGYFVADAEPALIVCDPTRWDEVTGLSAGAAIATLDAGGKGGLADLAARQPAAFDDVARGADDLAAILYTSGTTGRSKGAMLSHDNLASNAETLAAVWRFTGEDVLIHTLPLFHVHGLFTALGTALVAGASIRFMARFDADSVLAAMPHASVFMGVPTFYTRLLGHAGLTRAACRSMRLFVSGSAPLLAETHRAFAERTGHAIVERYGMTETGMNTSNPYDGERRAGTVGPPLPGTDVRIADPETGAVLPQGEIGMIELKGRNVFKGYWRLPERNRAEFRDGWFVTGDLGRFDPDGYLQIVGRAKDVVITGGYNVYPKEVESEIDALPGVLESAVIGLVHADLGEAVTALVVPMPGAPSDEAAILAALAERLAAYKRPRRVLFVEALPRNAMGKVQKAALRASYADLFTPEVAGTGVAARPFQNGRPVRGT